MEFVNGFLEAWGIIQMPALGDVGFTIGIVSVLASAVLVVMIVLVGAVELMKAIKHIFWPRPFIPNTRHPPK